jgi:hypothetical protein
MPNHGTLVYVPGASDRGPQIESHLARIRSQVSLLGMPFEVVPSLWGEVAGARLGGIELTVPETPAGFGTATADEALGSLLRDGALSRLERLAPEFVASKAVGDPERREADVLLALAQVMDVARRAATEVAQSHAYLRARMASVPEPALIGETANAVAVLAVQASLHGTAEPRAGSEAEAAASIRLQLAKAVLGVALGTLVLGYLGIDVGTEVKRWATDVVVPHRVEIMQAVLPGPADILVYLHAGSRIRQIVRQSIADAAASRPVVAMGSSLGAVILLDALREDASSRPDLMVTVGSQSPLLQVIGALDDAGDRPPFQPWLNVNDRRDLLGFWAERVWPDQPGVIDTEVDMGVGFPDSHGATYLSEPQVYVAIRRHLEAAGLVPSI